MSAAQAPFRVLSFGAGVQTIALLWLWVFDSILDVDENCDGFFNGQRPDLVVFADTQAEPRHVYTAVEEAKHLCAQAGIPFETVSRGDLSRPPTTKAGIQKIYVPVYTRDLKTGKEGQLERQCTAEYKVRPVERYAKKLAGKRPIEMNLGISLDEAHRMKRRAPDDRVQTVYPLVFGELGGATRDDCARYLAAIDVPAAKSACSFCPYRRDAWWAWMYRNDPACYAQAVAYDEWVRDKRPGLECFIHDSRRPLKDVVPELIAAEDAQTTLFPIDLDTSGSGGCEEGHCGT